MSPRRATPAAPATAPNAAAARTATRAYRRMPDAREVVAVWRKGRTVMTVANHFGVPRHTATGWLRRLREQGVIV